MCVIGREDNHYNQIVRKLPERYHKCTMCMASETRLVMVAQVWRKMKRFSKTAYSLIFLSCVSLSSSTLPTD